MVEEVVRVVPDLAADGEGLQRVGDRPPVCQLVHEGRVELPLGRGHPQQEDVLVLRGEGGAEDAVVTSGENTEDL